MTELDDTTDPKLDALLRRQFSGAVADDGFTTRVMRALPPRRLPRRWLLPVAAVVGTLLAWLALMPSPVWQQAAQEWLQGDLGVATAGLGVLMFVATLASCAWSLEER
jgi:hypothetical protein